MATKNTGLKQHKRGDKVKWIITLVAGLALTGAVVGLSVKLARQTTVNTVGGEAYSIGALDEKGAYTKADTSIYLRKAVTTKGFKCELQDKAKIKYQLFYYDEKDNFISASEELTADFNGTGIPATAKSVKIVITPTEDEDGKVSLTEVLGYAGQLKVIYNK